MARLWRGARVRVKERVPRLEKHLGHVGTLFEFLDDGERAIVEMGGHQFPVLPLSALENVTKKRKKKEDTRPIGMQIAERQKRRRR